MRRRLIFIGIALFLFSMLAFISATLAAPQSAPLFAIAETEPNNVPSQANPVTVNSQVTGVITQAGTVIDTDYFSFTTQAGIKYVVDLSILTTNGMKLQLLVKDSSEALLGTSSASNSSVQLTWDAPGGVNYIQIRKQDIPSVTIDTTYQLEISLWSATSTPTPPDAWDAYEQNDTFAQAHNLPVGTYASLSSISGKANFFTYTGSVRDTDWYAFYVQNGHRYEAYTDGLVNADTVITVTKGAAPGDVIATDDNGGGGFDSRIVWDAAFTGYYYIHVSNNIDTTGSYDLTLEDITPSTATPVPAGPTALPPTWIPGVDPYEPNHDFDHATVIVTDKTYSGLNFIPCCGVTDPDNDFFKLWVKPGLFFTCDTQDLGPGVDPNMIFYDTWGNPLTGNDDTEIGDYNSHLSYFVNYEGWLYVLVGHGGRLPLKDTADSDYSLRCTMSVSGGSSSSSTSTPRPTTSTPTRTPTPSSSAPSATPGAAAGVLSVRPLTTPTPPPTSGDSPGLRFVPIDLLVYYDANEDASPGAGEGIAGILVIAYDTSTGAEIAQGFTDSQGHLEFTTTAQGAIRLSIPYLGISHLVGGDGADVRIRIAPQSLSNPAP